MNFHVHPSHQSFTVPRPPRRAPRQHAFTLIELLLAILIGALLMLTLYMTLTTGLKGRDTIEQTIAPVRAVTLASDLIGRDLQSVMPPPGTLVGPFYAQHQGSSGAASDRLEFYSVGSDGHWENGPLSEGIRRIYFETRNENGTNNLYRRITRNLLPTNGQDAGEEEMLCRNVSSFELLYFDGTQWLDNWDSSANSDLLPQAVQMILEINYPTKPGLPPKHLKIVRFIPISTGQIPSDTTTTGGTQ